MRYASSMLSSASIQAVDSTGSAFGFIDVFAGPALVGCSPLGALVADAVLFLTMDESRTELLEDLVEFDFGSLTFLSSLVELGFVCSMVLNCFVEFEAFVVALRFLLSLIFLVLVVLTPAATVAVELFFLGFNSLVWFLVAKIDFFLESLGFCTFTLSSPESITDLLIKIGAFCGLEAVAVVDEVEVEEEEIVKLRWSKRSSSRIVAEEDIEAILSFDRTKRLDVGKEEAEIGRSTRRLALYIYGNTRMEKVGI